MRSWQGYTHIPAAGSNEWGMGASAWASANDRDEDQPRWTLHGSWLRSSLWLPDLSALDKEQIHQTSLWPDEDPNDASCHRTAAGSSSPGPGWAGLGRPNHARVGLCALAPCVIYCDKMLQRQALCQRLRIESFATSWFFSSVNFLSSNFWKRILNWFHQLALHFCINFVGNNYKWNKASH